MTTPNREEHRIFAQHAHSHVPDPDSAQGLSQCAINLNIREDSIVREVIIGSNEPVRWAPERVKDKWESLVGRTWEGEHVADLQNAGLPPPAIGPFLRSATDGLAFPMTILWALEKLNDGDAWTKKATLTIHVSFICVWSCFGLRRSAHTGAWSHRRGAHASHATRRDTSQASSSEEAKCKWTHHLHSRSVSSELFSQLVLIGPGMETVEAEDGTPVDMDTCPRCSRRRRQRVQYHYAR